MNQEEKWLLSEKYNNQVSPEFQVDCARLANGVPLAYLIGHVPFLGCTIYLDEQPLIPRPETEWWVEEAIVEIKRRMNVHEPIRVLDLCAGSGAIGIAVAKHVPEAKVDFIEIDTQLLPTIEKNITTNCSQGKNLASPRLDLGPVEQYRVIAADLFRPRSNLELGRYEYILCNPPYIDPALDRTETSVKEYEPHTALYGGENGLALIKQIIATAPQHLNPQGQLWLEHEPEQAANIVKFAKQAGFAITTHTDQFGVQRYSVLVLQ